MSASKATVWGRLAVYSTLAERRHRMLGLRTSDLSVARWNRHGSLFGGRVVQVHRQQTLAGHLCMLVNDQWVTCGRAGTAWTRSSAWSATSASLAGRETRKCTLRICGRLNNTCDVRTGRSWFIQVTFILSVTVTSDVAVTTVALLVHSWYMILPSTWRLRMLSVGWESCTTTPTPTSLSCLSATRTT